MVSYDQNNDALSAANAAQAKLAERMRWPWWRHAASGLLFALLLLATTVPNVYAIAILGIILLLTAAIIRDDKKRYGMFVSGYQRGRTGWVIAAIFAVFAAGWIGIYFAGLDNIHNPILWIIVGGVFLTSTALSYVWEVVYRADLRKGRA